MHLAVFGSFKRSLLAVTLFAASSAISLAQSGIALVRHAPTLNGTVEGSVQQMLPESVTLNGGTVITGDLLIPGTPTVRLNGNPTYGGTVDLAGTTTPTSHQVTLNGNARLSRTLRRANALALPSLTAPPQPTGARTVIINSAGQSVGDFATLRHLTLNGSVGQVAIPPGTYGDFVANGNSGFTLGIAGATTPAIYNLQRLTLNGTGTLTIAGPVMLTVGNSIVANGTMGAASNPEWLTLQLPSGDLTLNGNVAFHGYVVAPAGTVLINGNSRIVGGAIADRLTLNGNSLLRLVNAAPAVALTAPAGGTIYDPPATIALTATASDRDGAIARVEFFDGSTKLGEDTSVPYQFTLDAAAAGTYNLTARAIDNSGAITSSATVTVMVNSPPAVALTAPAAGAIVSASEPVALAATATDTDGTVAKVEFFAGATKLGEDTAAPFQFSWTNAASGNHVLTAIATDNRGTKTTSSAINIVINAPPTVALTAPTATTFPAPATVALAATAADGDGTIAKVEFFAGTTRLGEDTSAPYQFSWDAVPAGTYALKAVATDNLGATTTSAIVSITVAANAAPTVALTAPANNATFTAPAAFTLAATALDPEGAVAKVEFFQNGTKLGEDTAAPFTFSVAGLAAGSYAFTARASDALGATGTSAAVSITVTGANTAPVAQAQTITLAEDALAPLTLSATDAEGQALTYTLVREPFHGTLTGTPPNLTYRPAANYFGTDTLIFKATDGTAESAPATVVFTITPAPDAPTISLTATAAGGSLAAPATLQLAAAVHDIDGDFDKVEFFQNGTKLGETPGAPFTFTAANLATGTYTFTARVTDLTNLSATSAPVQMQVVPAAGGISVALTAPLPNETLAPTAPVTLRATASATEGGIARVEFYSDETKLGEATAAPYEFVWSAPLPGRHLLAARAITSTGAIALSSSVSVQVTGNQPPSVVLLLPEDGVSVYYNTNVTFRAQASDADNNVRRIEFYRGETLLLTHNFSTFVDGKDPIQRVWSPDLEGTQTIFARAFDAAGASGDSAPVTLHVISANRPPVVTLTAPAAGAPFAAPATLQLSATASDPDGTIAKVEFYADTQKLAEFTAPPYSFTWANVPAGNYVLKARAYDDVGAQSVSAPRPAYVAPLLPHLADFEVAEGFQVGALAPRSPWTPTRPGGAQVTSLTATTGTQSIVVRPSPTPIEAAIVFAPTPPEQTVVFYDFWARPVAASEAYLGATFGADGVRVGLQIAGSARGEIYATEESDGTFFAPTGITIPLSADGAAARWHRFTFRQDYTNNRWDLWVDGAFAAGNVRFAPDLGPRFKVKGDIAAPARLDGLLAGLQNPLFADSDQDGMSDAWELAHGLDPNRNDRNGDLDGDGLSNIQEHALGLKPNAIDSDGDGLPDRWEMENGHDPRWPASLKQDTDGDGLPDLWEYRNGTYVWSADSDGDGISDSLEDDDGDGATTLAEFQRGTDPNDFFDGVPPRITPLVGADGALGTGDVLLIRLTTPTGTPLVNAPVKFTATVGGHLLATTPTAPPAATIVARTGPDGVARAYVKNSEN